MGLAKYRTAVITLSDKGAAGERKDESGLAICERLRQNGQYEIVETLLLPDDCALLKTQLVRICDEKLADLILTTGGTGFPREMSRRKHLWRWRSETRRESPST